MAQVQEKSHLQFYLLPMNLLSVIVWDGYWRAQELAMGYGHWSTYYEVCISSEMLLKQKN